MTHCFIDSIRDSNDRSPIRKLTPVPCSLSKLDWFIWTKVIRSNSFRLVRKLTPVPALTSQVCKWKQKEFAGANPYFLPYLSETKPQAQAPVSMPANTTLDSRLSSWGERFHSSRTTGPRNDNSMTSIASATQPIPAYARTSAWNLPNPIRVRASSVVYVSILAAPADSAK